MRNAVVNVNGRIMKPGEAQVDVFDRGYLYGDSLYEVARTYDDGRVYLHLDAHLARLENSARLARMVLAQPLEQYRDEMYKTLDAFHRLPGQEKTEAYGRIIVSRGNGRIGFSHSCLESSTLFTVIVQPLEPPGPEQYARGARLGIVERLRNDRRALDPAMKSGNYLNSLLAYLEAEAGDFDDALMANADGHLTEGTTFNFFYARGGILATPPLDIGILDGITRRCVIELAREAGLVVREVRFPRERLYEADEAFITSTIKEVYPITSVDGRAIGDGKPGPLTRRLGELFRKAVPGWLRSERRPGA
jgi:branched-chain amino acid aminotransferase